MFRFSDLTPIIMSVKILPIYFTDKSKRHIVASAFFLFPRLKTRVVSAPLLGL